MAEFSLALNEDQETLKKWVHDFAEDVIRPAAHEWDQREETPWPILEEAAAIGLYGWEFLAEIMMNDPTGLSTPVAMEELFWGGRRDRHGDHGLRAGGGRDRRRREPGPGHGVGPPVLRLGR